MQNDYGGSDAVHRKASGRNQKQEDISPPLSHAYTWSLVNAGDALVAEGAANSTKRPDLSPSQQEPPRPIQAATSSGDELESLFRGADQHLHQLSVLRDAVSSFLRRSRKLAPVREDALLLRSRVEFEWVVFADHRRFVSESEGAFLQEAAQLCDQLPPEYSEGRLQKLYEYVLQDHKRQSDHVQRTRDTEHTLSNLEYGLQQKESKLAQAAKRISEILSQITLPDTGGSQPSSPPTEVSRDEMPGLIQHYFSKANDVHNQREHIIEIEVDHREARTQRMLQADQEIPLADTDEEFEAAFAREYLEAEQILADLIDKADLAKQVCLGENLDPESYRKAPSESARSTSSDAASDQAARSQQSSDAELDLEDEIMTPSKALFDPFIRAVPVPAPETFPPHGPYPRPQIVHVPSLNDRVRSWIQTIENDTERRRSRSLSASRQPEPSFKTRPDGSVELRISYAQARKFLRQRDLERFATRQIDNDAKERPTPLKRSQSESELVALASKFTSQEDLASNVEGFRARLT